MFLPGSPEHLESPRWTTVSLKEACTSAHLHATNRTDLKSVPL